MAKFSFTSDRALRNINRIIEVLAGKPPMSADKLSEKVFMCPRMTRNYLNEMQARGQALVGATPEGACPKTAYWTVPASTSFAAQP